MPVPRADGRHLFRAIVETRFALVSDTYIWGLPTTRTGSTVGAVASPRYRPECGVATECGFGRRPNDQDVRRLIELHAQVVCWLKLRNH